MKCRVRPTHRSGTPAPHRCKGESLSGDLLQTVEPAAIIRMKELGGLAKISNEYVCTGYLALPTGDAPRLHANPLFFLTSSAVLSSAAPSVSRHFMAHYGSNPVAMFFHAESVLAHTQASGSTKSLRGRLLLSSIDHFAQQLRAFEAMCEAGRVTRRLIVGDAIDVCQALQMGGGGRPRHWQQGTLQPLVLDAAEYAASSAAPAPRRFDVIDTSNLSDHLGALHILLAICNMHCIQ
jgi:hypothetical protein